MKHFVLPLFMLGFILVATGCEQVASIRAQLSSLQGTNTEKERAWVRNDPNLNKLIVFVHGFDSSNDDAWGQFPALLKGDQDFKDFNSVLFGYPTKLCGELSNINDQGAFLASFLTDILNRTQPKYRRIVLVGHSMGGLVILKALLNLERDHFPLLQDHELTVLTFATPYMGVENTARPLLFCRNKQIEDLRVLNDGLHALSIDWTKRINQETGIVGRPTPQIPLHTFWGTLDRFVTPFSACGYALKPCEAVDGDHYSIVKPTTRDHLAYQKLMLAKSAPHPIAVSKPAQPKPDIVVQGVMPVHLREEIAGPDKMRFIDRRLGFIVKALNPSTTPQTVEVVVLEGCVSIDPLYPREAFIDRELLPKPLILNEDFSALHRTAVQKIRMTGAVRADSRVLPPGGVGYVGVLLPLPSGKSGASMVVENSASLKGQCSKIPNPAPQPSIAQLLDIGPIHYSEPKDIAQSFRDGSLRMELRVGNQTIRIDPRLLSKLQSLQWKQWRYLDLGRMYEVPETDYPPTLDTVDPGPMDDKLANTPSTTKPHIAMIPRLEIIEGVGATIVIFHNRGLDDVDKPILNTIINIDGEDMIEKIKDESRKELLILRADTKREFSTYLDRGLYDEVMAGKRTLKVLSSVSYSFHGIPHTESCVTKWNALVHQFDYISC